MNISIDINRSTRINHILENLNSYDNSGDLNISLNFSCSGFIESSTYLLLTSFINEKRENGHNVNITLENNSSCDQINYASRIDFFNSIDLAFNEQFGRNDTTGNLIPISNLPCNAYGIPEGIFSIFRSNFNISDDDIRSIQFIVEEMICNTTIHSKALSGAYYYFQKYPQRRELEFILVDSGRGIRNSLITNPIYEDLVNEEAVKKAFEFEVTCGEGRGHGLFIMKEIVKKTGGRILLYSGRNAIFIDENNLSISDTENWDGVYLNIKLKLGTEFKLDTIFEEIDYSVQQH